MLGYLDDPEATAAAIDADGWLHTGDVGTVDDAGNLRITDRLKDMYICGGFNVYPAEVEQVLARLDGRRRRPRWSGCPTTASARSAGPSSCGGRSRADEDDVIAYTREHLANFKAPRSVVFLDANCRAMPAESASNRRCERWCDGSGPTTRRPAPSATRCATFLADNDRVVPDEVLWTPPRASNSTAAGTGCSSTPGCR